MPDAKQLLSMILRGDPAAGVPQARTARQLAGVQRDMAAPHPKQSVAQAQLEQARIEDLYGRFSGHARATARVGNQYNSSEQAYGENIVLPAFIQAMGRPPKSDQELLAWYSNLQDPELAKIRGFNEDPNRTRAAVIPSAIP